MSFTTCPECAARITDQATICPNCGRAIKLPGSGDAPAPIHHTGGKLQAIGVIMVAGSIIAMLAGAWWGAALLFPAIVIFILGRFW